MMNSRVNLVIRALLLCLVFHLSIINVLTQNIKHKCESSIFDFSTDTSKTLGDFSIVVENGNFMTKFYKLPDTKLIISNTVGYFSDLVQEDIKSAPPGEVFMSLVLGKKPFKERFFKEGFSNLVANPKKVRDDVLSTAFTVLPLDSFKEGMVMTMYLEKKQLVMVSLECRDPDLGNE